jgi:hypothetical protein
MNLRPLLKQLENVAKPEFGQVFQEQNPAGL